jgi:hypothetical protein
VKLSFAEQIAIQGGIIRHRAQIELSANHRVQKLVSKLWMWFLAPQQLVSYTCCIMPSRSKVPSVVRIVLVCSAISAAVATACSSPNSTVDLGGGGEGPGVKKKDSGGAIGDAKAGDAGRKPPPPPPKKDGGTLPDSGAPLDAGATEDFDAGGSPGRSPEACAALGAGEACGTCCAELEPAGEAVYYNSFLACACVAGVCETECGSNYCLGENSSSACSTCLDNTTCWDAAKLSCPLVSSSCGAYLSCADPCYP